MENRINFLIMKDNYRIWGLERAYREKKIAVSVIVVVSVLIEVTTGSVDGRTSFLSICYI